MNAVSPGAGYVFGRFAVEVETRRLLVDGVPTRISARAFDLLLALISCRGRMVEKDELLQLVWPGMVVEESNIYVHISTLRKLLGPQIIVTTPGRGYCFAGVLEGPPGSPYGPAAAAEAPSAGPAADGSSQRGQPISLHLLRPPRLVGRESALRQMRTAWQLRHVFLVEGEAGLGKSRVLDDFIQANWAICRGGARPGDDAVPYSSAARLFASMFERFRPKLVNLEARDCARLVPALADRGPAPALVTDADRLRFHASLQALVSACQRAGAAAIVFDDLQFADPASIGLLGMLLDAPSIRSTLRFGLALRRGESTVEGAALIERLDAAGHLARIALEPLDAGQIEDLVSGLELDGLDAGAWGERLAQQVGGNPAFLLESLKTLLAEGHADALPAELPIPSTVRGAVERRLHYLGTEALSLAQLAAVAGTDFSVPIAARILGRTPLGLSPELAQLERMQILRGTSFAHDIVRDAVNRSVPDAIREYLHRALATAMQADEAPPGRVAIHWAGAHCWERAGVYWRAAADHAAQASQLADQARFLDQAADCFARAGQRREQFEAVLAMAGIEMQPDYASRVPAYIERLRALQIDERERMEVDIVAAGLAILRGHYDECESLSRSAVQSARRFELAPREVAAGGLLAYALVYLGRPDEALAELDAVDGRVAALTDAGQRAAHFEKRALVLSACGRMRLAIAATERVVQIGQESRNLALTCEGEFKAGVLHAWHGNAARAVRAFEEAIALRQRLGSRGGIAAKYECQLGASLRDLGRYREALAQLDYACQELDDARLPGWAIKARADLAETYLSLGLPQRALHVFGNIPEGLARPETAARLVVRARIEREALADGAQCARRTLAAAAELLPASAALRSSLPVAIEQARDLDAPARAARLDALGHGAYEAELIGLALYAAALATSARSDAGDAAGAAQSALRALPWLEDFEPAAVPRRWVLEAFAQALLPADPAQAAQLRDAAAAWERRIGAQHVPDEFLGLFLERLRRPDPLR
jgi:DNA-binding winged helix-turn-helix (wHTH) protein/tetratricopeptide (TPR) repeat protein